MFRVAPGSAVARVVGVLLCFFFLFVGEGCWRTSSRDVRPTAGESGRARQEHLRRGQMGPDPARGRPAAGHVQHAQRLSGELPAAPRPEGHRGIFIKFFFIKIEAKTRLWSDNLVIQVFFSIVSYLSWIRLGWQVWPKLILFLFIRVWKERTEAFDWLMGAERVHT